MQIFDSILQLENLTAETRFQFAVDFAAADLRRLDEAQRARLTDNLMAFVSADGTLADRGGIIATAWPAALSAASVRRLHGDVRQIIASVVDQRSRSRQKFSTIPLRGRFSVLTLDEHGATGRCVLTANGSARDMFLLVLFSLLANGETCRLRRCPECETIFVRVRKQLYCSRRCVNRVNNRDWRQTEKGRAAGRAAARRQYAQRRRQQLSATVRISPRVRRQPAATRGTREM